MLYHLIYPLAKQFTFLNVFGYITFRSVIGFIITFTVCIFFFPRFIHMMNRLKANQIIREDGPKSHLTKIGTPTMGGIIVILAILIALLVSGNFENLYIWIIFLATISFALVGFIDDYIKIRKKNSEGLHGRFKMLSQILIATIITISIYLVLGFERAEALGTGNIVEKLKIIFLENQFAYVAIPFVKDIRVNLSIAYIPFGVFIIVATSNAVNLTDGLDGLASGLLIPVVGTFGLLTYISGHAKMAEYLYLEFLPMSSELLVYCFAMIGGLAAFLWFNSHPAQIFMGDTGSLCFGGIIGTIAIMIKQELLFAIIGGVFLAETISVIIQVFYYKLTKKRFFLMAPLHHHFELKGMKESKIISRFYIIGGILAIIALGSLKLR